MLRRAMMAAVMIGMMVAGAGAMLRAQPPQGQPPRGDHPGRGEFAGMQHVEGVVTAVAGATVKVKTEDGATMRIVTTENTRIVKGRGVTVKVADLKVGDGVMAAGNLDAPNKALHAAILFATDAEQLKTMRENLGKTYIAGRVTAIDLDNAKMTVERPDHVAQTIGLDVTTSFRRGGRGGAGGEGAGAAPEGGAPEGGESITLADIKVGDMVRGTGSVKNGIFVPTQLEVVVRGQGGGRRGEGGAAGASSGSGPSAGLQ